MKNNRKTIAELWEDIFSDFDILKQIKKDGHFDIKATEIKAHSNNKEPRLMTKFDFKENLPKIFKDNDLTILPIAHGVYRISKYELYKKLTDKEVNIEEVSLPKNFETLNLDEVYSEANALHIAELTGIFDKLLNDDLYETISGRMGIKDGFEFNVNNGNRKETVYIDNPLIEIDGGYEGNNNVLLVEAKNRKPETFIVRQLYFPLRYWDRKVNKKISTFFFVYDNGIYSVYDYEFKDKNDYNSLTLKSVHSYVVKNFNSLKTLKMLIKDIKPANKDNNKPPFPQADSMNRIIQLIDILNENDKLTAKDIATELNVVDRQGAYYGDALMFLDIVNKEGKYFKLNSIGKKIANSYAKKRNKLIASQMLKNKVFYEVIEYAINNNLFSVDKNTILKIMKNNKVLTTEKMYRRRASTVKHWTTWLINSNI